MRTLLYEYKQTRRELRRDLNEICKSFEEVMKPLRAARDKKMLKELNTKLSLIKKDFNFMISNVEYVINWLEHGREPGKMRGADITKVYLKDPQFIDSSIRYKPIYSDEPSRELTSLEKEMVDDAMCTLSKREREVYLLYFVDGCSLKKIAGLLGVEKGTIQKHLERAEKKIKSRKEKSIFLI